MELRKVGNEKETIFGTPFQKKVRGVGIPLVACIHVAFGGNQQLGNFNMTFHGRVH
jgi:hypothetical protein